MKKSTPWFSQIFILFLFAVMPLLSCQLLEADKSTSEIRIKGVPLKVEWANTEEQRVHGLQHRRSIPENEGMMFDYGDERILSFWMKDTSIPLSIAFIDKNGTIEEIQKMNPNTTISHQSRRKVRYALEVNQGWFERHDVKIGDKVEFQAD